MQKFRKGDYSVIVVSHVLNEGVDVPDARVAILLSGSGSTREYIQRLGRVLRKGSDGKVALLYEVVAEQTSEEGVARRRKQQPNNLPDQIPSNQQKQRRQLSLVPTANNPAKDDPDKRLRRSPYKKIISPNIPVAAESSPLWDEKESEVETD